MENSEDKYLSCDIIETGFDAQIRSIDLCCRVSSQDSPYERFALLKNYNGEKIDWTEFFKIKQKIRDDFRNGNTFPQCQKCLYIKEENWTKENYFQAININNWIKCNANCVYCDRDTFNHIKAYNIYPVFKSMIENNLLRVGGPITISGGEPTIIREFDKLLNLFLKHKMKRIKVLTNAIKYNRTIEKGLKIGDVNILVSTDSGTRETFKKIKRTDKHKDVWKNVKKYAQKTIDKELVKTKFIVIPGMNDNEEELFAWLQKNVENEVKFIELDLEIAWFYSHLENKEYLDKIYALAKKTFEKATELNLCIEAKDRMVILFNMYNDCEHKNPCWCSSC